MRRTRERKPGSHVVVTLTLEREQVIAIDAAAHMMEMDRQGVLERGFALLTSAATLIMGHETPCGIELHLAPGPMAGRA